MNIRVSFQVATRYLVTHLGRTLLTGSFIFLTTLLLILSASLETGMRVGIAQSISQNYTGDIVLIAANQPRPDFLFSPIDRPLEPIANYPELRTFLQGINYIANFMPGNYFNALVIQEFSNAIPIWINAVNLSDYQSFFPKAVVTLPASGKNHPPGLWLTEAVQTSLQDTTGICYGPPNTQRTAKTTMTLMAGIQDQTNDLIPPIQGLIRYATLPALFQHLNLMDNTLHPSLKTTNYVTLRIFHPEAVGMYALLLNSELKKAQLNVRALTWYQAAPKLRQIIAVYSQIFHGIEWVIMAVAVLLLTMIFCTNFSNRSLAYSVIRVIGGSKTLLSLIGLFEIFLPAMVFCTLGLLGGWATVHLIRISQIPLHNEISQMVLGGTVITPLFNTADLASVCVKLGLVIGVATLVALLQIRRTSLTRAVSEDR